MKDCKREKCESAGDERGGDYSQCALGLVLILITDYRLRITASNEPPANEAGPEAQTAGGGLALDEEIEEAEGEAKEKKEGAHGKTAARELDNGIENTGGNDAEAGLTAAFVEGADGNITREITPEKGKLVIHPECKLGTIVPEGERAENKNRITQEG